MSKGRLLELDSIRGLAALAVVFYHFFYRYNTLYEHDLAYISFASFGIYGVNLFFMVSGFVIYWTLNRTDNSIDFIVSRFSRLYPVYWFSVILTFFVVFSFGLDGRETTVLVMFKNFLMFHEYFGVPHVDGVYWTLTLELTFYFWIFIIFKFGYLRYTELVFSLLVVISSLYSLGLFSLPDFLKKLLMLKYISFFTAGICFYKIANDLSDKKTIPILFLCLISTIFTESIKAFVIFFIFYIGFYLATSGRLKVLTFKPLVYLGGISYSLYLTHQNIGYVIINKTYEYALPPIVGVSFALISTLALASLLTKYIEKPALRGIRKINDRK